jgi:hypothetical protein
LSGDSIPIIETRLARKTRQTRAAARLFQRGGMSAE